MLLANQQNNENETERQKEEEEEEEAQKKRKERIIIPESIFFSVPQRKHRALAVYGPDGALTRVHESLSYVN